jgi:hypothetical protein
MDKIVIIVMEMKEMLTDKMVIKDMEMKEMSMDIKVITKNTVEINLTNMVKDIKITLDQEKLEYIKEIIINN